MLAAATRLEVSHKLGIAVLWHDQSYAVAVAVAVAETEMGRILAWDGWYSENRRDDQVRTSSTSGGISGTTCRAGVTRTRGASLT